MFFSARACRSQKKLAVGKTGGGGKRCGAYFILGDSVFFSCVLPARGGTLYVPQAEGKTAVTANILGKTCEVRNSVVARVSKETSAKRGLRWNNVYCGPKERR